MSNELTIIYYTSNRISEFFANNIRKQILKAIGNIALISVSQKPIDFGKNICVGNIGRSNYNIYKQALIGAKKAKTKYVAMCEDDVLYTPEHFTCYRPDDEHFAYNFNRWNIYTWSRPPIFSYKHRIIMNQLIAPRELLVKALEERFKKYPTADTVPVKVWSEIGKYERHLGVTIQKTVEFNSPESNIMFSHSEALGYKGLGKKKKHGDKRVKELLYWGEAKKILEKYYGY